MSSRTIGMLPSFEDLAVFLAIVREGSFTAAGRALGVPKQTISERIARLEDRLGVQLLVRSTRALRLTAEGERYHASSSTIIAQLEEANRIAQQSQRQASGTLRVTSPLGLSRAMVMPLVHEYRRAHPGVRFELIVAERIIDLVRERVDLAIRAGPVHASSSLIARPLFEIEYAYVASPAYLASHGGPTTAEELRAATCIALHPVETWTFNGRSVRVESPIVVNTPESACDAALAGIGIAQVPIILAVGALRIGSLRIVAGNPVRRTKVTALWPARRLPTRVRLFVDLLVRRGAELAKRSWEM